MGLCRWGVKAGRSWPWALGGCLEGVLAGATFRWSAGEYPLEAALLGLEEVKGWEARWVFGA
ncbi:hypothetical protein RO07_18155 [Pandoraea pulmonicola]|uniref:Uncharacterized protein n=1 Tax=Pandoraea pulmonicola TaxID=93221 RepID=A0ABM5S2G2_PANPU|nr:hypothetical protein RO07_18155 [Pandoraea pulmonicola]